MSDDKAVDPALDVEVLHVRRQPSDWRVATYRRQHVGGLHWTDTSGGINVALPQLFLHGYVLCNGMLSGELAHSCQHGPPPHSILVCVLKKDNPNLWAAIENEIGPRPGTKKRLAWEQKRSAAA